MSDVPQVDPGPVQMGNFPTEAYKQYEENQEISQSPSSLRGPAEDAVAFRSTIAAETALLDEFTKLSSRFSKFSSTLVDKPYDLNLSQLFLPSAIGSAFTKAAEMSQTLEHFLASPSGLRVASSGQKLQAFINKISELNSLSEAIHTQMSRINKG